MANLENDQTEIFGNGYVFAVGPCGFTKRACGQDDGLRNWPRELEKPERLGH